MLRTHVEESFYSSELKLDSHVSQPTYSNTQRIAAAAFNVILHWSASLFVGEEAFFFLFPEIRVGKGLAARNVSQALALHNNKSLCCPLFSAVPEWIESWHSKRKKGK